MNTFPTAKLCTEFPHSLDELAAAFAFVLRYEWGPTCFEEARFYPNGKAYVRGASTLSLDLDKFKARRDQTRALHEAISGALKEVFSKVDSPPGLIFEFVSLFPDGTTRTSYKSA